MEPDVNLDVVNNREQDALWLASAKGHIDIVKVLIEKLRRSGKIKQRIGVKAKLTQAGAVRSPVMLSCTPLEAAEYYAHDAVVRVLRHATQTSAAAQTPTPKETAEQASMPPKESAEKSGLAFMLPPTAPGAHDADIDYGVLAPDITW